MSENLIWASPFWIIGFWFLISGSSKYTEMDRRMKLTEPTNDQRYLIIFIGSVLFIYAWLKTKYGV